MSEQTFSEKLDEILSEFKNYGYQLPEQIICYSSDLDKAKQAILELIKDSIGEVKPCSCGDKYTCGCGMKVRVELLKRFGIE